ncbi:hypothetical protein ACFOWM_13220 [Ferruginibacter yonginensis]|uniref:Uncharacterized protein n=1 Tax=Ferruginibacter yonginensis TaxID=1310416 RepID=A0ABV8QUJ0_9BACT
MTLVIAQKHNNTVTLSSDSRISFGTSGHIDYGIKVFSVPVKIFSPTNSETNTNNLDYDHILGVAVVGSAINAYTVKESVYEILQNLQYIPGYTDLSMYGISKLVFKIFEKTTLDLGKIIQENGLCGLILTGYCAVQKKIRTFYFSCDTTDYPIRPFYEEILKENGIRFFGSGEKEAEQIHTQNTTLTPSHIIRQVIREGKVNSVGGGIQYGEIVEKNFKVYGIADYSLTEDGRFKEHIYTLRGINLYKDDFEKESDGFHISYPFKMPFESEIQIILNKLLKNFDNPTAE